MPRKSGRHLLSISRLEKQQQKRWYKRSKNGQNQNQKQATTAATGCMETTKFDPSVGPLLHVNNTTAYSHGTNAKDARSQLGPTTCRLETLTTTTAVVTVTVPVTYYRQSPPRPDAQSTTRLRIAHKPRYQFILSRGGISPASILIPARSGQPDQGDRVSPS